MNSAAHAVTLWDLLGVLMATALGAYLIGSIPFGIFVSRVFFKSDIRSAGSGNIGAANAMRTYGKAGGFAVLVLDGLKGFVPAWYAHALESAFFHDGTHYFLACVAVMFAVLGHCYTPWLKFKGGKGVATFLGALFAFSAWLPLVFVAVWLALVVPTRYASLGSVVASLAMPVAAFFMFADHNVASAFFLVAALIVGKHRDNLIRLSTGNENKIGLGRAEA